jgi:plasmid stabilization system protein ParE
VTGVGFHPEARTELLASVTYYDEQADGLGRQFTDEVERAVGLVAEQPGLGAPIVGTELRRWALRRFPYYLIYRAEPETLLILAVAHQRRRPGYWEERS